MRTLVIVMLLASPAAAQEIIPLPKPRPAICDESAKKVMWVHREQATLVYTFCDGKPVSVQVIQPNKE